MISYAQNFEDVMLHRVFRDQKDGFYIDVGAMDPMIESVTKFFYDQGWSGINIEPNEYFYSKLLQARPRDINLNLAVGEREGCRPLYVFEQYGISTFDESNRDRFVAKGYEAQTKNTRITTLAAICQDYVRRPIDFLKVDCEGWEEFALRGADWERFRPIVLIVEGTTPGTGSPSWSAWEPYLIENAHYEMVYFDGLNRFYLRREYTDLRSHFEVPPNVFDEFTLRTTAAAEQARQGFELERDNLVRRLAELENKLNSAAAKEVEMQAQATCAQARIAELEKERQELNEKLLKTRLWVGQLSQDVAASKQRW